MKETIVVALGGNAILQRGERGTFDEQLANVQKTCAQLVPVTLSGDRRLVITHGNGPQVGNILIQHDTAKEIVPAMPMDVCGAKSQGLIGYMFGLAFRNLLAEAKRDEVPVATVVTQVRVESTDPAFENPSKPVGPFYSEEEAKELEASKGWTVVEDAGRGWRRVVPSPDPKEIIERESIRALVESGAIVVSTGGGGIPVVRDNGTLRGVEAVIDKDLGGQQLARDLGASAFLILTDVDAARINYGKEDEEKLGTITVSEGRRYLAEGHFAKGSMGPKVEAALRFVEGGGQRAIIASLQNASAAIEGTSGTQIVPDKR